MRQALFVVLCAAFVTVGAEAAKFKKVLGESFPAVSTKDVVTGDPIVLADVLKQDGVKGAVVFFTSYHCPVAVAYEERVNELAAKYKSSVPFIGLNANASEGAEEQAKYARDNKFGYHIGMDDGSKVAKEIGAGVTPEFYLVNNEGKIVFHGPLDDSQDVQYIEDKLLANAIEAHAAGKEIPADKAEKQAFGCGIAFPKN